MVMLLLLILGSWEITNIEEFSDGIKEMQPFGRY
jgi:hypothetical protein